MLYIPISFKNYELVPSELIQLSKEGVNRVHIDTTEINVSTIVLFKQ
jgi:hypothetical protein